MNVELRSVVFRAIEKWICAPMHGDSRSRDERPVRAYEVSHHDLADAITEVVEQYEARRDCDAHHAPQPEPLMAIVAGGKYHLKTDDNSGSGNVMVTDVEGDTVHVGWASYSFSEFRDMFEPAHTSTGSQASPAPALSSPPLKGEWPIPSGPLIPVYGQGLSKREQIAAHLGAGAMVANSLLFVHGETPANLEDWAVDVLVHADALLAQLGAGAGGGEGER